MKRLHNNNNNHNHNNKNSNGMGIKNRPRKKPRTTISSNRANAFSLRRLFVTTIDQLRTTVNARQEILDQQIRTCEQNIEICHKTTSYGSFHQLGQYTRELATLQRNRNLLQTECETKTAQCRALTKFNTESALVFANRLLENEAEVYPFDNDTCTSCGALYVFNAVDSTNVCTHCNLTIAMLFTAEDTSADTLILRAPVSGTVECSSAKRMRPSIDNKTNNGPSAVTTRPRRLQAKVKILAFERFIRQFELVITEAVLAYVHRVFVATVHILSPSMCRSTAFGCWLKERTEFLDLERASGRIVQMFGGLPVAQLSDQLIQKLISRFQEFTNAMVTILTTTDRKKCNDFEYVAHQFLVLESEHVLARQFQLAKTRVVLRACDLWFHKVSSVLAWPCVPRSV